MKPAVLFALFAVVVGNGCAWVRPPTEPSAAYRKSSHRPGDPEGAIDYPNPGINDTAQREAERGFSRFSDQFKGR